MYPVLRYIHARIASGGISPGPVGTWLRDLSSDHPLLYALFTLFLLLGLGVALGMAIEAVLSALGHSSKKLDYEE